MASQAAGGARGRWRGRSTTWGVLYWWLGPLDRLLPWMLMLMERRCRLPMPTEGRSPAPHSLTGTSADQCTGCSLV